MFNPIEFIEEKRDGKAHSKEDIWHLVMGVMNGTVADYQLSAWLMAAYLNGLNDDETGYLTGALANSGDTIKYPDDLHKGATNSTGRPVQVRRLLANNPAIVSDCNALYLGKLTDDERSTLFQRLNGQPVLSISERDDRCIVGTLFCLRVGDEQVSFEVNLDSVARSGVRIHPSVLQLSRRRAAQP